MVSCVEYLRLMQPITGLDLSSHLRSLSIIGQVHYAVITPPCRGNQLFLICSCPDLLVRCLHPVSSNTIQTSISSEAAPSPGRSASVYCHQSTEIQFYFRFVFISRAAPTTACTGATAAETASYTGSLPASLAWWSNGFSLGCQGPVCSFTIGSMRGRWPGRRMQLGRAHVRRGLCFSRDCPYSNR